MLPCYFFLRHESSHERFFSSSSPACRGASSLVTDASSHVSTTRASCARRSSSAVGGLSSVGSGSADVSILQVSAHTLQVDDVLQLQRVEDEELLPVALVQPRAADDAQHRVRLRLEVLRLEVELLEGALERGVQLSLARLARQHLLERVARDVDLGDDLGRLLSRHLLLHSREVLLVLVQLALDCGDGDGDVAQHLLRALVLEAGDVAVRSVDELAVQLLAARE